MRWLSDNDITAIKEDADYVKSMRRFGAAISTFALPAILLLADRTDIKWVVAGGLGALILMLSNLSVQIEEMNTRLRRMYFIAFDTRRVERD